MTSRSLTERRTRVHPAPLTKGTFRLTTRFARTSASGFRLDRVGSGQVNVGDYVTFVADAIWSDCYSSHFDWETWAEYTEPRQFQHEMRCYWG